MQLNGITQGVLTTITGNSQAGPTMNIVTSNQDRDSRKLDNILSSLSQMRPAESHIGSTGIFQASEIDVITRVLRAESRIVIPLMEQIFKKYNAITDKKLDSVRRSIDMLGENVGSVLSAMHEKPLGSTKEEDPAQSQDTRVPCRKNPQDPSWDTYNGIAMENLDQKTRRVEKQKYHLGLRLPVGNISITIAIRTKKKGKPMAQAYQTQTQPYSKRYCLIVTFVPSQRLRNMKGFTMLYGIKQNHLSTYPEICPSIIPFNVIPPDAETWQCIIYGDEEGLRRIFTERRASPNDRGPSGPTLIEVG